MGGGSRDLRKVVALEKLGGNGSESLKATAEAVIRLGNELLELAKLGYCSLDLDKKSLEFELFQEFLLSILVLDNPVSRYFHPNTSASRVLERQGIITVRDLVTKERGLIAATLGAGKKVMAEIDEFMASHGLEYGTPAESLPNKSSFADVFSSRG